MALGSVLVMDPEVLLLDEPTSGLDPKSQTFLIELMFSLNQAGKTIVVATHDLALVDELNGTVAVLSEEHKIEKVGPADAVLSDEELSAEGEPDPRTRPCPRRHCPPPRPFPLSVPQALNNLKFSFQMVSYLLRWKFLNLSYPGMKGFPDILPEEASPTPRRPSRTCCLFPKALDEGLLRGNLIALVHYCSRSANPDVCLNNFERVCAAFPAPDDFLN